MKAASSKLKAEAVLHVDEFEPESEPEENLDADENQIVAMFAKCSMSVVHITTQVQQKPQGVDEDTPFYFQDPGQAREGAGSGFIWDSDGHVVTNYHVIRNATEAKVTLADGTTFDARLVGKEPDNDIAVLKVQPKGNVKLQPLRIGNSDALKVGRKVYAIGNPFGLDQTLTAGIVSGLGREITGISGRLIRKVVQTDAAINPGNSGGPLITRSGKLIGVNTMIASPSGAFAGVGFAVPSNTAAKVVREIVKYGKTIRPWLGVYCAPDSVATRLGMVGVVVMGVEPGSPADESGLKAIKRDKRSGRFVYGDEILAVDERRISKVEELLDAIEGKRVGSKVTLKLSRDGTVRNEKLTLAERPAPKQMDETMPMEQDRSHDENDQYQQQPPPLPRPRRPVPRQRQQDFSVPQQQPRRRRQPRLPPMSRL